MNQPNWLMLNAAIEEIRSGTLSSAELWTACTSQIARLNPRLNAFITLMERQAELDSGTESAGAGLGGAPIAVKDLFHTAGVRTTAGSLFFKDYVPDHDSVVVAKIRAAGGQIIGKTNTHEIALGLTTINPHYGACRNPWDVDRISGGSSGGSAVAVAAGMASAAVGTDTGGSIRVPASLCGVVGLKPTYGRVSLRGVFPLSWNLDHAGPLTRSVADAALLLQVIAGYDPDDPHCQESAVDDYVRHLDAGVKDWRICMGMGSYIEGANPEILDAVKGAAAVFEQIGATVEQVDLSFLREAALANGLMTQADGAAYHRQRLAEHPELFGSDVRKRLETGRDTPTADYVLARRTQTEIRRRLVRLLEDFEILMLPTTAITAPPIDGGDSVEHARRLTRFTAPFNLTGLPAISIPCGFSDEGLPLGLQLVAGPWKEGNLLRASRGYERESDWNSRRPPV